MRAAFISALTERANRDDRVMLLTGDLGFMVVERFAKAHGDRFLNMGVAEANMVGVATGLARQGFVPFCYSIATFATMRALDQFRNGPVLHRLPVRIVGTGGGFAYGTAGATHHAIEDIGVMRLLPGCAVICPSGDTQAVAALDASWDWPGPVYFRLAKDSMAVEELNGGFDFGRVETVFSGDDLLLVTTGAMTRDTVAAARSLREVGVRATVAVVQAIAPVPAEDLAALLARHRTVITVEDHGIDGGLGTVVGELISEGGFGTKLIRMGISGDLGPRSGSEAYLRRQCRLDVDGIVGTARMLAETVGC